MLDLKKIRETPDAVKEGLVARGADPAAVDEILALDAVRREKTAAVQALQNERNATSTKIGAAKKAGEDTTAIQAEMRALGDEISAIDKQLGEVEENQRKALLRLPNLPADDVVAGGKEANAVVKVSGEKPVFGFEPKNHVDLCLSLGLIDYERGVKIIGATAHFVNNNLDEGPIITQDVVRVNHEMSWQEMRRAGRNVERNVLASALDLVFDDRIFVYNNKTVIF